MRNNDRNFWKRIYLLVSSTIRYSLVKFNSWKYRWYVRFRYPKNVYWGKNITVYGKLILSIHKNSFLVIGNNVVFRSSTKHNYIGINKPVSIAVHDKGKVTIGSDTGFSGTSIYCATSIEIGAFCNFGGNTFIWDTDFHPIDFEERRNGKEGTISKPVIIEDDVFVGANSTILKGSKIGSRSVIGACSVVSKKIGNDEIWAGNPIAFIRTIK